MTFLEPLIRHFKRKQKSLAGVPLVHLAPRRLRSQWRERHQRTAIPHGLPGSLMVNLTSYPARYDTLYQTLQSLLLQSLKPDKLILWLFHSDVTQLPAEILALQQEGLTIETWPTDIKSYKKLIPALCRWPEAYHVTADDDIYYRPDWLAELVAGYNRDDKEVICLRAHYITLNESGAPLPYRHWLPKTEERGPSNRLFLTSGAGVLFPPGALHADVTDADKFSRLSPNADDIWFYWMAAINQCRIRRVGDNKKLIVWKSSKATSLWHTNKRAEGGNDQQIANMIKAYGLPPL